MTRRVAIVAFGLVVGALLTFAVVLPLECMLTPRCFYTLNG